MSLPLQGRAIIRDINPSVRALTRLIPLETKHTHLLTYNYVLRGKVEEGMLNNTKHKTKVKFCYLCLYVYKKFTSKTDRTSCLDFILPFVISQFTTYLHFHLSPG